MITETEFKSNFEKLLYTKSINRHDIAVEHSLLSRAFKNLYYLTPNNQVNRDARLLYSFGRLLRDTELYLMK